VGKYGVERAAACEHERYDMAFRAVICGGGVAGLEAALALRGLQGAPVDVTVLSPDETFEVRAFSVGEPFALAPPRQVSVADIAADAGAALRVGTVAAVDAEARHVTTRDGEELAYDALLVAVGARQAPALPHATTFGGPHHVEALRGVLSDMEQGFAPSIAFVVPARTTWALPAYELALLTAGRARSLGLDVALTVVTPEDAPLALFGAKAAAAMGGLLRDAGVEVMTDAFVEPDATVPDLRVGPGGRSVHADRVVALPRLDGPRVKGLPADADGFIPIDDLCRVTEADAVFAAGDATSFPVKQGGIAAQQADVAATAIAALAGVDVVPQPFRPVLRGMLLTGEGLRYLRATPGGHEPPRGLTYHALWWPPTKLAGRHLGPYLFAGGGELEDSVLPADADGVHVRVDAGDLEPL
jgi:sulfide:quinone oxidoreductase